MDAGLAAVLGAVVGAIGTGGAGITAAFLNRSQVRMQVQAEHIRFLREPRKSAYVAYIEVCLREFERLTRARRFLVIAARTNDSAAEFEDEAQQCYDDSSEAQSQIEHLQAQVYVEGPTSVIDKAVDLSSKLIEFRHSVLDGLQAGRPVSDSLVDAMWEKRSESYGAYLDFLYAASEALGADGIRVHPE
jgi:hypothetical protein